MDQHIVFGKWLELRRKALDLTQSELAKQVGCASGTIRKFESSVQPPSKQLAKRLAECLALPPEYHADFVAFARGTGLAPFHPTAWLSIDQVSVETEELDRSPRQRDRTFPSTNDASGAAGANGGRDAQQEKDTHDRTVGGTSPAVSGPSIAITGNTIRISAALLPIYKQKRFLLLFAAVILAASLVTYNLIRTSSIADIAVNARNLPCKIANIPGYCPRPVVIGAFDIIRGGDFSFKDGPFFENARAALKTSFPNITMYSFTNITTDTLKGVDAVILNSVFGAFPCPQATARCGSIAQLSQYEQKSLRNFIESGGCAIILADNGDFAPSNKSLLEVFDTEEAEMLNVN